MKLHWLSIGILAISATLFAQGPPPQQQPQPGMQQGGGAEQGDDAEQPDEPGPAVARLGMLNGDATVKRGDSSDWVPAVVNAPLMSGDEISVGAGGRAEVQLDAAHFLRVAGDTDLRLADLENNHFNIQLAHGLITWRILRDTQSQAEISTPLVSVHPGAQSVVRVEVSADGVTRVTVRRGDADVSTQKGTERVAANSTMIVQGSANDPEFQIVASAQRDEWDGWSDQRDTALLRAQSPRYVTQDVDGVEDLDSYGNWVYDPSYGWVWQPTVASSWAPYQDGNWTWEDSYGWTWVDAEPWGWAPFHYGNWYNRVGFGWSWYPGARGARTWWRPAMVGFFGWGGGGGFGFGFGNIGWVPLAPFERFHPWYGRRGFGFRDGINVNVRSGNVLNSYRNARFAGGVTAVSANDFERGNFRNRVAVDRGQLQQASLVHGALPVTPTSRNLRFNDRAGAVQNPRNGGTASNQRFFGGRNAGNAGNTVQRAPFAQQQSAMRSAFGAQGQAQSPGRMQSQPGQQNRGTSGFQRFEGSANSGAANERPNERPAVNQGPNQGVNQSGAAPGWNRFNSNPQQARPEQSRQPGNARGEQGAQQQQARPENQPRQFQVSPSIVRERPQQMQQPRMEAPRQQPMPRMQSAPEPRQSMPQGGGGGGFRGGGGGGSAPRSEPAGGGGHSSGGGGGGSRGGRR